MNYPYFKNYNENKLFDPYNAFIRGNSFKNEYIKYKNSEPYEIKPMNEQANLLTKINSLEFIMKDLNLYLDINPNDQESINLYNNYNKNVINLKKEYQDKFGPLNLDNENLNTYPWAWIDMPWPWDN